ncbi:MAG: hypothetical protein RQ752_07620, partial [Thermohalobaculum sp.]|nr:hypothetical protein [Thermohalobaculum sp.]
DEVVRARLAKVAGALAGGTARGEITLADGMPGRDWPQLVERGLGALASLESGVFEVAGIAARLAGIAATPEAAAAVARRAGGGIALDIAVADPMPAARLEIGIAGPQAAPRLIGARLPGGLDRAALTRALPELDMSGAAIETGGRGQAKDWEGAIAVIAVALPRLATGRIAVEDRQLAIDGRLRTGFSSAAARDALRQAAGAAWQLVLALDEAPLPADITLRHGAGGTVVDGILPDGIAPEAALLRLGGAAGAGLTSGGAGDPAAWRRVLDALAALRMAFEAFQARVTEGRVEIAGTLAPGASAAAVADSLKDRIGAGWAIDMAASAAPEAAPPAPRPAEPTPPPTDTMPAAPGGWMVSGATPEPAPDLTPDPAPDLTPETTPGPARGSTPQPQATAIVPSGGTAPDTGPAMADSARRRAPMPPRRPTPNP